MRSQAAAAAMLAVLLMSCHGFAQTEAPLGRRADSDVTIRVAGSFIPHAEGKLIAGPTEGTLVGQSLRDEAGGSIEYRRWWGNCGAGILFVKTPTASVLRNPVSGLMIWRIREDQVHLFSVYRPFNGRSFTVGGTRIAPYVVGGFGAMVLNGGRHQSGYDGQFLSTGGVGADFRFTRKLSWNVDYRLSRFTMPTFDDRDYRSQKVEASLVQTGVTWTFGKRWPW